MIEIIKELERQAYVERESEWLDPSSNMLVMVKGLEFSREKFAELIVRECADAADMAYNAHCKFPGDYVAEQMGYGADIGVVEWRSNGEIKQ